MSRSPFKKEDPSPEKSYRTRPNSYLTTKISKPAKDGLKDFFTETSKSSDALRTSKFGNDLIRPQNY